MSAGCQVLINGSECGISAIGRCAVDGRAFCMSHQARTKHTSAPYANRCQPCEDKADAADWEYELHYGQYYLVNVAAQELRAAGIPTVEIFTYRTEWVTKRFGRSHTVEHGDLWATGWILGEYRWGYDGANDGPREEGAYLTALLDQRKSTSYDYHDRNCARVHKDQERGRYLVVKANATLSTSRVTPSPLQGRTFEDRSHRRREGYEAIATTIHRMAGT